MLGRVQQLLNLDKELKSARREHFSDVNEGRLGLERPGRIAGMAETMEVDEEKEGGEGSADGVGGRPKGGRGVGSGKRGRKKKRENVLMQE